MRLSDFGFEGSKKEAFCTGLLAQALSLSPEFSRLFLVKLGCDSSKYLKHVNCEEEISSESRPDIWLRIGDVQDASRKPDLILIESKTISGESGNQMKRYTDFVRAINAGKNSEFRSAKLVLLSMFKNMPTSAEPDMRISWNDIIDMMARLDLSDNDSFERRYFDQICEHLTGICSIPEATGDAADFSRMMQELVGDRTYIECRQPGKQISLYVVKSDPWVASRNVTPRKQNTLVIMDLEPPKFNSLSKKWFSEWITDKDRFLELEGEARRNGENVEKLKISLENLLSEVDRCRGDQSSTGNG